MRRIFALAALAAIAGGCSRSAAPTRSDSPGAQGKKLNLVVMLVDTLRADHLGCFGYQRRTSPNIDRLASESVLFENAYSHAPWTMPSVASLFTSLEPKDHGIATWKQPLEKSLLTVAEHLKANGFHTEGYVSHGVLTSIYQFDQGFGVYDGSVLEGHLPRAISTAKEVTDLVLKAVSRPLPEPFFLWIHYFDPHEVYMAHRGFEFGDRPVDRYDSEVAYTDQQVGRLLDDLRTRGLLDRSVVVLLADHGEAFGEHRQLHHSNTLYEQLLHIPLIFRIPGWSPARQPALMGVIDVMPTALSLLGVKIPEAFRGRPLRFANGRFEPGQDRVVVSETKWDVDLRSIREGRWKLIENHATGGLKLFDIQADPGETKNLRKQNPEVVKRLCAMLNDHYARGSVSAPEMELTEEHKERLRSLGYLQ